MANVLKNPQHVAKIGYQGFDLSKLVKFSSTVGELLPKYYTLCQPGDKFTMSAILKTRTMNLDSAAMCSIKEHLDWFFVPMEQLYKPFGSWYYGIQDIQSDMYDLNSFNNDLPMVETTTLNRILKENQTIERFPDYTRGYFYNGGDQNDSITCDYYRLLDCFLPFSAIRSYGLTGARPGVPIDQNNTPGFVNAINPMFLCAYQKIYMDYYRLSDREENDPSCYNLDSFYETGVVPFERFCLMMKMRYRAWAKDFFTNIQISPLFGAASPSALIPQDNLINNANIYQVNQWLTALRSVVPVNPDNVRDDITPTSLGSERIVGNDPLGQTLYTEFSPANIRTMFAAEKLLEITRRAGKHYDKQTLAHFGVDVPTGISGEVSFIGSQESVIQIGDVISTAGTEDTELGQVGGKGYGYGQGRELHFTAPCHGILMCIYSAEPEVDYTDYGLNKLHTLISRADWFSPEYDDLGMQPLYAYQSRYSKVSADKEEQALLENSRILGWQWRYSELKKDYNVVQGALADYGSLYYWTTSRKGIVDSSLKNFLINPQYLNTIMHTAVQYVYRSQSDYWPEGDDEPESSVELYVTPENWFRTLYNHDPLIHELYFDVKKASKMSTYGLPSL